MSRLWHFPSPQEKFTSTFGGRVRQGARIQMWILRSQIQEKRKRRDSRQTKTSGSRHQMDDGRNFVISAHFLNLRHTQIVEEIQSQK